MRAGIYERQTCTNCRQEGIVVCIDIDAAHKFLACVECATQIADALEWGIEAATRPAGEKPFNEDGRKEGDR